MWGHRVCRNDPPTFPQVMRHRKLVIVKLLLGIKSECHQRQSLSSRLGHDQEAKLGQGGSKEVGRSGQVEHDRAVALLAQTNHLVVLANDLGGAFGEVEREGGLVGSEVVDVEDEFLR